MDACRSPQCVGQAREGRIVFGQAEPQEVCGPIEAAAPDMLSRQTFVQRRSIGVPNQTEQWSSPDDGAAGGLQNDIEPSRSGLEALTCGGGPSVVLQRGGANGQGWAGHRPGTERIADQDGDAWMSNGDAEPHACKTIEFSKRTQDDHRQVGAQGSGCQVRRQIDERLIDHEPATLSLQQLCGVRHGLDLDHLPVGIVWVDDDRVPYVLGQVLKRIAGDSWMSAARPRASVLAISRRDDRDFAGLRKPRQPLNKRLRAGCRNEVDTLRNSIGNASRIDQRDLVCTGRKLIQRGRQQVRCDGPGVGIDAGGQIHPHLARSAVTRDRFGQVAAMFHARLLPLFSRMRESVLRGGLAIVFGATLIASPALAKMPRVASINVCTDQLLLALADPEQIVGLSPYSRDAARSWAATEASRFLLLSGEAEDVLVLKPDVVVAGRFTKRATRELLKEKSLRVVEFDAARTIDDVRVQIRRMGDLIGQQERASRQIARLDAALARARTMASRSTQSVLAVSRRGWVSGGESLTTAMLNEVGLSNKARTLGLRLGGFASLETIVNLKPDLILLSDGGDFAEDQGKAFLLHPALERLYPPEKRLVVPERLTVCGGPMLSDALDRLTAELARAGR